MIVVSYKGRGISGIRQIPFDNKRAAIEKAELLYKSGHSSIKVSKITEDVLYIPGIGSLESGKLF